MKLNFSTIKKAILALVFLVSVNSSVAFSEALSLQTWRGLNTSVSPEDLSAEYGTVVNNIRLNKAGALTKRAGRISYNGDSLGANPINFLYRFYYGSSKVLLASYSTTLKKGTDADGTFADIKTGLTASTYWRATTYKSACYLVNGTDTNQRYDGTNVRDMGLAVPVVTSMASADGGAGAMEAGVYSYKVTYVYDSYQESNASAVTGTITQAASHQVALSSIPKGSATSGVTARKIYRTEHDGSVYYYLATISDNTTTTYADNTPDSSLDTTITPPSNHDTPPTAKYILSHKDRIFLAGNSSYPSRLYYSTMYNGISYPDAFPALNYWDVSPDDGEKIMMIAEDPSGNLCVFKQTKLYKLFTDGSTDQWSLSGGYENCGVVAPYSVIESPYGIFFLSRSGQNTIQLRLFDGGSSKDISDLILPTLATISPAYIDDAVGIYADGKYFLAYTDSGKGGVVNNNVLVYDIKNAFWSQDTNKNIGSWCVWNSGTDKGELYSGDSVIGNVYHEESSQTNIFLSTKSHLDAGTFVQTESDGTEAAPTLTLKASDLTDDYADKTWDELTSTAWNDLSGDTQTWDYSGTWTSAALYAGSVSFSTINWFETLDADYDQDIGFRVKSAATSGGLAAATYSDWFYAPGSDVSAASSNTYIQIQFKLSSEDADQTPTLYKESSYFLNIGVGQGTLAEDSIAFEYQTGKLDFGMPYIKKRLDQIRTNHDDGDTSYDIFYSLDGGNEQDFNIVLATYPNWYKMGFPYNHSFCEELQLRILEESAEAFEIRNLNIIFRPQPVDY